MHGSKLDRVLLLIPLDSGVMMGQSVVMVTLRT